MAKKAVYFFYNFTCSGWLSTIIFRLTLPSFYGTDFFLGSNFGKGSKVNHLQTAVLRSRAGLSRPSQPTGSFLFLGPTGVML